MNSGADSTRLHAPAPKHISKDCTPVLRTSLAAHMIIAFSSKELTQLIVQLVAERATFDISTRRPLL